MFKYLPKNISVVDNDRSRIELSDTSTKLLLDLSFSEAKTIYEIFSTSGVVGLFAASTNPGLLVEEFVTNVQDYETISSNSKNNKVSVSISPTIQLNKPHQKADIVIIKTLLEKRRQYILKTALNAASLLQENGIIYLVGAKDEGIQSIAKQLSKLLGAEPETITYKKGVHLIKIKPIAKYTSPDLINLPQNYQDIEIRHNKLRLILDESVFAKGGFDPAAKLLAENMVISDGDNVLDLGCGSGVLGMVAKLLAKNVEVVMVDSDYTTVELCKQNIDLNGLTGCRVLASDGISEIKGEKFNVIITNPPFHQGKQTSYSVAERFVKESHNSLLPGGKLFVVCNIFLPYEGNIQRVFNNYKIVAENKSYKVISAIKH